MIINAEEFKPKEKGKSDFYSWNLYRWLKKQDKEPEVFKKSKIYKSEDGELYIGTRYGMEGSEPVVGVRLRSLCSGSSIGKFPLCGYWGGSKSWKDVTESFLSDYERRGVCAIHDYAAHKFEYLSDGNSRMCQYCGKIEKKVVTMVERVSWECVQ